MHYTNMTGRKVSENKLVLYVSQKALLAEETRIKSQEERKENTSKRAAIEGTNSALKRAHGADKLTVRGLFKCKLVMGMKIIAHNFRQITRYFQGDIREKIKKSIPNLTQGILVSTR